MMLSGCGQRGEGERSPRLRLYPGVEQTDNGWQMEFRVRHKTDWQASIHDVSVIAFDGRGNEVCRVDVGDFPEHGRNEHIDTVTCEGFPAIITATARETPCEGAQIQLFYYVSDQDPADVGNVNDSSRWEGTWRQCDEELPPERVLEEVNY